MNVTPMNVTPTPSTTCWCTSYNNLKQFSTVISTLSFSNKKATGSINTPYIARGVKSGGASVGSKKIYYIECAETDIGNSHRSIIYIFYHICILLLWSFGDATLFFWTGLDIYLLTLFGRVGMGVRFC